MHRAVYFSNVMGVDMGMFYKRRDYSRIVNGKNPIVAHEFLGDDVAGKDVIIVDDMISSGGKYAGCAKQLKNRKAARVLSALLSVCLQTDSINSMNIITKDISTKSSHQFNLSPAGTL